jgi:hypothetical protein
MSTPKIEELNEEQVRERLMVMAGEFGPEVIRATYEDVREASVRFLVQAGQHTDDTVRLDRMSLAVRYSTMAEIIKRADALAIDRQEIWNEEKYRDNHIIPLEMLRENTLIPHFKIGQIVYMTAQGMVDPDDQADIIEGYMEVVITGIEHGHDYAEYQVGHLEPNGVDVAVIDDWVSEEDLHATMPELNQRPRPTRAKPFLTVVKD